VSNFDRLHPALQHHMVNSLGWRALRPFQDAVIPSVLSGEHLVVLAPTAGGKTEAAFFPALSRMLTEGWSGLSILYICPIKALLNNLDVRLERYCSLLGRRSTLWHGDIKQAARRRILREPPDCLLTTPESLEVMLVSPSIDSRNLFANIRLVVVDEIHAFAGDDRGWHLLAILERIARMAGREIQRIGLSATVGNPEALLEWLTGSCSGKRRIFRPDEGAKGQSDVTLDYVGSLQNAAVMISRLHRGEKRLVFVDSRARAEQLGANLRQFDVTTFVTHSSLGQEQRNQAEQAFAARDNCVIVATSVLELGIDVGDLDRVIQIDSPPTVSSFLQRMGRTGRRQGVTRNCLFLATSDDSLVRAAALIDLWNGGFIEPIVPPPLPYHILAQQMMALTLQERGIGRDVLCNRISAVSGFRDMTPGRREEILQWMLDREILTSDQGILGFGRQGEETFGRKNFLELFSVFLAPPLFTILQGRQELGFVDELTFLGKQEGPRVLLLGGRSWLVNHIDWQRRRAYVEATDSKGRSRWKGWTMGLDYALCQSIKRLLIGEESSDRWSRRASERIQEIRREFAWLENDSTVVSVGRSGEVEWWTFGGTRANATLANALGKATSSRVESDGLNLTFETRITSRDIESALAEVRSEDVASMAPTVDENAIGGLKFSECLPERFAVEMLEHRLSDMGSTIKILDQKRRYVAGVVGAD
jgi:ATP-dependent helicase Lhr and Lhr-like helicase